MQGAWLLSAFSLACAIASINVVPTCIANSLSSPSSSATASPLAQRLLAEMQEQMKRGEEGVTFPVYHRSMKDRKGASRQLRSTLDVSNNDTSNNNVTNLNSTLVTLNESFGQYFSILAIGTPSIDIAVIIDTGSELLWIDCAPCTECGVQAKGYEVFDPSKSTSFTVLSCSTNSNCPGDETVVVSCQNGQCTYLVTYGDNSTSSGSLSTDILTVQSATKGAPPYQQKGFVFGCGNINTGIESQFNASGLMGLDRGSFSIISQLAVNIFAYCLPNRIQTTGVTGYLTLGRSSLTSNIPLTYTPMIQNNASSFVSQFYYMNMTGISINGKLLDIPSLAFEITPEGDAGGTTIDSGTALTSFVDEAYSIFAEAFANAIDPSLTRVDTERSSQLLCYQVPLSNNTTPQAPNVTLHFADNLDLNLDTDQSFRFLQDSTYNYYCMAFNNAGSIASGGRNFIGNYQQQNFLVEYDIANSRIGFAPHVCD